jgi:hypothetical protein
MTLGCRLFFALGLDQPAKLADFFCNPRSALRDRFKFQRELPTLSAERLNLRVGIVDFGLQTPGLTIGAGESFLGLRKLVAQPRRRRDCVEDGNSRFFLLPLQFRKRCCGCRGFLLRRRKVLLGGGQVGSC